MRTNIVLCSLFLGLAQLASAQGDPMRGPLNQPAKGVIDGVVIQEELPVRTAIEYEHVRSADYVWSKRVYSRIDSREQINQSIFLPFDSFDGGPDGSLYNPSSLTDVDNPSWNRNQSHWSLWTIMFRHLMLGDLTLYTVSSDSYPDLEDGYSLKYPLVKDAKYNGNDYFLSSAYKKTLNDIISSNGKGDDLKLPRISDPEDTLTIVKTGQSLQVFMDSAITADADYEVLKALDQSKLLAWWDVSNVGSIVKKDPKIMFAASNSIFAYNIKEDWFFDKERSVLDRRIISIAPVARYTVDPSSGSSERGDILIYDKAGKAWVYDNGFNEYNDAWEEREMFWLYFPELRNVIVNYYVYSEKSDAQWMSFDDLFWKRKFNAMIYKTSDKFDRDVEDYRYGVDALYEAEKIKEKIRTWEHDVWNF